MDDCLKLLKGEKDEQKFSGLLLATRLCQGNDEASVRKIYDAVGFRFLNRLLRTGIGKGGDGGRDDEERDDYLKLAVTVLATFCRVAEVALSRDILSMVPLFFEILKKKSDPSVIEECFECLLLIGRASPDGPKLLFDSGAIPAISSQISILPDGSPTLELSIRLLLIILNKLPLDLIIPQNSEELACIVMVAAKQFALLHSALKFEALHALSAILSFHHVEPLHQSLKSRLNDCTWGSYIRVGVIAILQNRVATAEKLEALVLADSMMNIFGEHWLVSMLDLPDAAEPVPVDRCLLLVLETSRIEVAVLLNELAYLKYEASKDSTASSSQALLKQRNLAMAYSLIEKTIKLIANLFESEGSAISEGTLIKAMSGVTETINLVFDFLQDAKEHGQRKGDDLLAAVRIIGSYLAETPVAFKDRSEELLEFMLSVEGEAEESSFYSTCFLLPMLCQTTTEIKGCKTLLSFGAHKLVIKFLVDFTRVNNQLAEDNIGTLFFACETILNILVKVDDIQISADVVDFLPLLQAFAALAVSGRNNDSSIVMTASSICVLVLGLTSEDALLGHDGINQFIYDSICELILQSLGMCRQGEAWNFLESELDLGKIVIDGYTCCANRFPRIKHAVERSVSLQHLRT